MQVQRSAYHAFAVEKLIGKVITWRQSENVLISIAAVTAQGA
jgi:hypothetical protein